ncbi:MAG TPA: carbohydrate ABC transporter permease, partial [Lachnospiraceae bacterium]|nr:carbohydrate ABC transporter permease [Lachnospiraceae bacterium]
MKKMKISRQIRHMTSKKEIKGRLFNLISYALLLIFGFVFIYPIVYMIL